MPPTTIAWCDHSINPMRARNLETGAVGHYCEKISPGCRHCYSSTLQARFQMPSFQEQRGSGSSIEPFLDTTKLDQVLQRKKPTKYFWADMTDLFGDWVQDAWLDECFATMALTPQHIHMVLTKRPERMLRYLTDLPRRLPKPGSGRCTGGPPFCRGIVSDGCDHSVGYCGAPWPLPNVWCGVSVENQVAADARIPLLLQVPAAIRFLSCEPLLSPIDLAPYLGPLPEDEDGAPYPGEINWIILGGESGTQARPCQLSWIEYLVRQCQETGAACFVKQLGRRAYDPHQIYVMGQGRVYECEGCVSCRYYTKDPKGAAPTEWPLALRIQKFPQPRALH